MPRGSPSLGRHPQRPCVHCGKLFWPKRPDTRFCGEECMLAWQKAQKRAKTAARLTPRDCIICGKTFNPVRKNHVCCSPECNDKKGKLKKQAENKAHLATLVRTCAYKPCSATFTPQKRKDQIYCSQRCADLAGRKFWVDRNIEKVRQNNNRRNKEKYRNDPELRERRRAAKRAEYQALTKEQRQEIGRKNRARRNSEKSKAYARKYHKVRASNDIEFRLANLLRARTRMAITAGKGVKSRATTALLGCSIAEARKHLESLFEPGMSWENHGRDGWHIDHIRPVRSFEMASEAQQFVCFNWRNLQPLWGAENISKNDDYNAEDEKRWAALMRGLGFKGDLFLAFPESEGPADIAA